LHCSVPGGFSLKYLLKITEIFLKLLETLKLLKLLLIGSISYLPQNFLKQCNIETPDAPLLIFLYFQLPIPHKRRTPRHSPTRGKDGRSRTKSPHGPTARQANGPGQTIERNLGRIWCFEESQRQARF
jgi:hypothetical protein